MQSGEKMNETDDSKPPSLLAHGNNRYSDYLSLYASRGVRWPAVRQWGLEQILDTDKHHNGNQCSIARFLLGDKLADS